MYIKKYICMSKATLLRKPRTWNHKHFYATYRNLRNNNQQMCCAKLQVTPRESSIPSHSPHEPLARSANRQQQQNTQFEKERKEQQNNLMTNNKFITKRSEPKIFHCIEKTNYTALSNKWTFYTAMSPTMVYTVAQLHTNITTSMFT